MFERYTIAEQLGETSPQAVALIGRILRTLGPEETRRFVDEALRLDAGEGLLTEDGSRRRTIGGTFFHLVKEHLRAGENVEALQQLFPKRGRRRMPDLPPAAMPGAPPPAPVQPVSGDMPPPPPPMPSRLRPRPRPRADLPRPASLAAPDEPQRVPTQGQVFGIVDRHLGYAPDIYRRSYHPDTGAVTLFAHFPAHAREQYAEAIAAAAREAGVAITLADSVHQGLLLSAVRSALPDGVPLSGALIQSAEQRITARGPEQPDATQLQEARETFREETGWALEFEREPGEAAPEPFDRSDAALTFAWLQLPLESGCYAIGAHQDDRALLVRFAFPEVASTRYGPNLQRIERVTGWRVQVHPAPHQERLAAMARSVLPASLEQIGAASVRFDTHQLELRVAGAADAEQRRAAQERFKRGTGWELLLTDA